ncbi:MAG: hypothetical protein R3F29_06175 [Planctomycetota bacterium]
MAVHRRVLSVAAGLAWLGLAALACACSAAQDTLLRAEDFRVSTEQILDSLVSSPFLADRGPTSTPIVIGVLPVENLTSDMVTVARRSQITGRIVTAFSNQAFCDALAVRFVRVEERGAGTEVTHTMAPRFASATQVRGDGRLDTYELRYLITDVATRDEVWSDALVFDREALGRMVD